MIIPKTDPANAANERAAVKVVPLADSLEALQQQLKALRRRQKLLPFAWSKAFAFSRSNHIDLKERAR